MITKSTRIALAYGVAILIGASSAHAETRSTTVSYHGLDLASDAGRAELNHRIESAAVEVCGDYDIHDADERQDVKQCRKQAIKKAQPSIAVAIAGFEQRRAVQLASAH